MIKKLIKNCKNDIYSKLNTLYTIIGCLNIRDACITVTDRVRTLLGRAFCVREKQKN